MITGNWTEALALTDAEAPKAAIATAAANAEPDPATARRLAKQAWSEAPGNPAAALAYARRLRETGHERRAQSVIRRTWAASPQPDLAAFALSRTPAGAERVKAVQRLIVANADHVESRLLMARTLLEAGQASEAKQQIEAVRDAGINQRRVWALAADIEEALGNETGARDALRHVSEAAPDPEWFCENCGTPSQGWRPVCPTCGEMGRIAWGRSRRQEVLPPPMPAPTPLPPEPAAAAEPLAPPIAENAAEKVT
jgi:HemY protein